MPLLQQNRQIFKFLRTVNLYNLSRSSAVAERLCNKNSYVSVLYLFSPLVHVLELTYAEMTSNGLFQSNVTIKLVVYI